MATKKEIVEAVSLETGVSASAVELVFDELFPALIRFIERDGRVAVPRFGVFRMSQVGARDGINPSTGAKMRIEGYRKIRFRAAKAVRDRLGQRGAKTGGRG